MTLHDSGRLAVAGERLCLAKLVSAVTKSNGIIGRIWRTVQAIPTAIGGVERWALNGTRREQGTLHQDRGEYRPGPSAGDAGRT